MTVKDKIGLRIDSYLAEELNLSIYSSLGEEE